MCSKEDQLQENKKDEIVSESCYMNNPVNVVLSKSKGGLEVGAVQLLIHSLDMNLAITVEGQKMIRRLTYLVVHTLSILLSLLRFTQQGDY